MIRITICRDEQNGIFGFTAKGHAGYAECGSDIVCAAVSAILQTAMLGLTQTLGLDVKTDIRDGDMRLLVRDFGAKRSQAEAILETMRMGLLSIRESQPKRIQLSDRRCKHKCTA